MGTGIMSYYYELEITCMQAGQKSGLRIFKSRSCRHLIICKSRGLFASHCRTTAL